MEAEKITAIRLTMDREEAISLKKLLGDISEDDTKEIFEGDMARVRHVNKVYEVLDNELTY